MSLREFLTLVITAALIVLAVALSSAYVERLPADVAIMSP
jgi:hypothetical protein